MKPNRFFRARFASRGRFNWRLLTAIALFSGGVAALGARAQTVTAGGALYDDSLQNGWENWSWATVNLSDSAKFHGGARAVRVDAGAYQAFYLHHSALRGADFSGLRFWINGGASASNGGQRLQVQATLGGAAQKAVILPPLQAETWQQITISLADLGVENATNFDGLWIQDASGTAQGAFWVDDIALMAPPPPAQLQISVDAAKAQGTIDERLFGINTAIWDSHLGTAATTNALSALGTTTLRFPGGSLSDDYDWQANRGVSNSSFQWASPFPTFARIAQTQGAGAYLCVNYGSGTPEQAAAWVAYSNGSAFDSRALGTDSKGRDWKTIAFWANVRASAPLATDDGFNFLRVSHAAPYGFKFWEIGNENYGSWEFDQHGEASSGLSGAKHDPTTYANSYAQFRAQMQAVDATVKIGAVIARDQAPASGWTRGVLSRLKTLGVTPDFAVYHHYPQEPGQESDAGLLAAAARVDDEATAVRALVNEGLGAANGSKVELAMTELNSVTFNPGKQSTSLVNGLFVADALAELAGGEFKTVVWWDLRNGATINNNSAALYGTRQFGDYGFIAAGDRTDTPANTPYPSFYGAKLLSKWARGGDTVVQSASNYAALSVHAAKLKNGKLALLVVNKDPANALSAHIALNNFAPANTAPILQYGKPNDAANGDLSSFTFNSVSSSFDAVFPSYSMTVMEFSPASTTPTATPTPSPTATATPVATATATPTPTPVPTETPSPTATPRPVPTATPRPIPTATPRPVPTATPRPIPTATPKPAPRFLVVYKVTNRWAGGFNADVSIKNNGVPISGWTLGWLFSGDQRIVKTWNGTTTQRGQSVRVANTSANGSIPTNGWVKFGFQATYSGTNTDPTRFFLNGLSN